MSTMAKEGGSEVGEAKLLSGKEDDFGGVIVEMSESMAMDSMAFVSILRASISHWKLQGKKGVWIKLPIELVNLTETAVKEGFWFHHAEPKYLMLVYWIPQTVNTIPANATHCVGIGAFVINDRQEVLVVQENSGKFRGTGVWKFPTGVVDQGEDISVGAVREVKEETGWMPINEYAAQPFIQKSELLKYMNDICLAKKDGKYSGFSPVPTTSTFSQEKEFLYLNNRDFNRV